MILYNGEFMEKEKISISPDDRGYYFGDGVYEVYRVYGGRLFAKEAHRKRFYRSAEAVKIQIPYAAEELEAMIERLVQLEELQDGTVYVQFTRGCAPRKHPFPADCAPTLYAACSVLPRAAETQQRGISGVTVPDIRWLRCDIKSLNLLPNVLAKQEALDRGADEAILHRDGIVTECSASNIMMVKNGTIYTHPANNLILEGVTRGVVLELAAALEIGVEQRPFSLDELRDADEAFVTGTTVEVTPIVTVDGRPVGSGAPGAVTRKLQQAFDAKCAGR